MNTQKKTQPKANKQASVAQVITPADIGRDSDGRPTQKEFSLTVRQLRFNARQGTVGVKGRSDVARSTKKPWKQKGTGRARAGTARSPLWRGGGVTFGPQSRTRRLGIPKKVRRTALGGLLDEFISRKQVIALDWQLENDIPKTAKSLEILRAAGLDNKPVTLFLPFDDAVHQRSFANINGVSVVSFDAPHAFHMAQGSHWVFLKKDMDQFNTMVAKWL